MDAAPPLAQVALALPGYAVVLFCCYSLAVVGVGLWRFPDCPAAADELLDDIQRARDGLAAKSFRVDGE